jgi:hypothetical protein
LSSAQICLCWRQSCRRPPCWPASSSCCADGPDKLLSAQFLAIGVLFLSHSEYGINITLRTYYWELVLGVRTALKVR